MSIIIRDLFIDTVACIGKIYIDKADVNQVVKDISKLSIDLVSNYFKENNNRDVSSICDEAKRHSVKKVVAIPYYLQNGTRIILLRAYGGNQEDFFTSIGYSSIPKESYDIACKLIEILEEKYGLEIYNHA